MEPGATAVMADSKGAGCINHIWMTTRCYAPKYLRKLVLEMYWDGEGNPSVRAPFGDFFGIGHATYKHYVSLPLSMVMGEKKGPKGPFAASMNCFPMPFADGAKIHLINESEEKVENLFYYVDYEAYDRDSQVVNMPVLIMEYLWEAMSKSSLGNGVYTVFILKIQSVLINLFVLRLSMVMQMIKAMIILVLLIGINLSLIIHFQSFLQ